MGSGRSAEGNRGGAVKIALLYTLVANGAITYELAARFAGTLSAFPGGVEHDTLIVCNGGPPAQETGLLFMALPRIHFYPRENTGGWDIAGYLDMAKGHAADYDAVVCCGESVYFWREGWLDRLVRAWTDNGPGMYGPFASYAARAHLNTTCFMTSPVLLRTYSLPVTKREERYDFEHGKNAFWRQCVLSGNVAMLVTWDGVWLPQQWRKPPNIFWRGDQSNVLCLCNHTQRWAASDKFNQLRWSNWADSPFQ